jgi:hypothetical protein
MTATWHQRSYEEFLQHYSQWNGTTWCGFVNLRATRPDLEMCVIDIDWGCGIVRQDGEGQDVIELQLHRFSTASKRMVKSYLGTGFFKNTRMKL